MHAYPPDEILPAPLPNPVTGKPTPVKDGEAHLQACLAEMKRLNRFGNRRRKPAPAEPEAVKPIAK